MKNLPLISVGIPTYNRPSGLRRVLECITGQDYENLQIIVADNCSDKEEVRQIVCEFIKNDKRIRYYRHVRNMGPVYNFNFALQKSCGDYFMWAGDDDEWSEKNYISKCAGFLSDNAGHSLVCGVAKYYENEMYLRDGAKIELESGDPFQRVLEYYLRVEDNSTFYGLFNKNKIAGAFMKNILAGDWLFLAGAAFNGRIGLLPDISFKRKCGGATASFEKISKTLGISSANSRFPYFMIALNAFSDIVFNDAVYGKNNLSARLFTALKISGLIYYKRAFMPWFINQNPMLVNSAVYIKKILKSLFGKAGV